MDKDTKKIEEKQKKIPLGRAIKQALAPLPMDLFPLQIFPESIKRLIEDSHDKMGFPKDITAAGILFAVSVSLGQSVRLLNPLGYYAKPILWLSIIAPRGSTKSHPINKAIEPINIYADEKYQEYEIRLDEFRVQEGGKKPRFKNPITNNSTIEGLYEALKSNTKGVGIHSDELSTWIKDFNKFNKGGDQQAYTQLFDGAGITVTRKNSETLKLKETFVSIIGSIQPTILPELFNSQMVQSGFTDRFLFQFPKGLEFVPLNGNPENMNLWDFYNTGIRKLLEIQYDAENPMYLRMEGETLKMFIDYYNTLGKTMGGMSEKDPKRGIYSKMMTYFGRFPLIIHGLRVAFEGKGEMMNIDERDVQGAIELTKYFIRMNIQANDVITNSNILDSLPDDKMKFYESMPDGRFHKKELSLLAARYGLQDRVVERFLSNNKYFTRSSWGEYEKKI